MDEVLLDLIERIARTVYNLRAPRRRVSKRVRDRVGDHDGWACRICGGHVDRDRPWVRPVAGEPFAHGANDLYPSVEHLVPVGAGGTNDEANLAICHLGCNTRQSHYGREADNYVQIRRAMAASDVLNFVQRARVEGIERAVSSSSMVWARLETLLEYFQEVGRAAETLPVRQYFRDQQHQADMLGVLRLYDVGTVVERTAG